MAEQEFMSWEKRYMLGIPVIDEQHHELVRLINTLYEACLSGETTDAFKTALKGAVDYVKVHFADEEKFQEQIKYPDVAAHKAEHTAFVQKVLETLRDFEKGSTFVPNTFVRFLKEWVLTHIAISDQKYADYYLRLKSAAKTVA
jgi:hemerythrin